jgi:hypothetical protein
MVVCFWYVISRSLDDISEVSLNDVRCCEVTRSLPNPAHGLSERILLLAHLRSWNGEGLNGGSCTGQGPYDDVLQDFLLHLHAVLSCSAPPCEYYFEHVDVEKEKNLVPVKRSI